MKHLIKFIVATFLLTMAASGWAQDGNPPANNVPNGIGELASIDLQIDSCCNPQVDASEKNKNPKGIQKKGTQGLGSTGAET